MPYMYILECCGGSYYTGSTWNLEKRMNEHENGCGSRYTYKHLPVKLVYCEQFECIEDAFNREKQVQKWTHKKKQALIESSVNKLRKFSKNYTQFGKPNE
jgi:putative endonuclease